MSKPKRVSKRQVRVGTFLLIGVIALATGMLLTVGHHSFFVPQYELKVFFPNAGGLRSGAQVRLDGIRVGNVRRIAISSYPEPNRAVEIDVDIARKYRQEIRGDSVATMQTTGLLGQTFVDISRGTQTHAVLKDGGVLRSQTNLGVKEVMENANGVATNFSDLGAQLTDITNHLQHGQGSIGEMVHTRAFSKRLNKTVADAQNLINQVNEGHGTVGKFFTNGETLQNKTTAAMDRMDQIMGEVQGGNGTMGKIINDQTLLRSQLNHVSTNTKMIVSNIYDGKGTVGNLATDREFHHRINDTVKNLDIMTTRVAQGKGTLGRLSTDSQLFQGVSSSVKFLKEFLAEFRKSPRKYLTLHFHIF